MKNITKDLKLALSKLKTDGVIVKINQGHGGDQKINIRTENYKLILSANDLGVWLETFEKIDNNL